MGERRTSTSQHVVVVSQEPRSYPSQWTPSIETSLTFPSILSSRRPSRPSRRNPSRTLLARLQRRRPVSSAQQTHEPPCRASSALRLRPRRRHHLPAARICTPCRITKSESESLVSSFVWSRPISSCWDGSRCCRRGDRESPTRRRLSASRRPDSGTRWPHTVAAHGGRENISNDAED